MFSQSLHKKFKVTIKNLLIVVVIVVGDLLVVLFVVGDLFIDVVVVITSSSRTHLS